MLRKRITILGKSMPILVPVAISLVVVAIAVAATYLTVIQTITQNIVPPPPPPNYGSIAAPDWEMPDLVTGGSYTVDTAGAVQVTLTEEGAGKALCIRPTASPLYTMFDVTLTLTDKPAGSGVGLYGYGATGGGMVCVDLDLPGTYTFSERIAVTAGATTGTATSQVALTLEDSTTPPGP